ncbi:MAG: hypothetical protein OHK0023_12990 [Anaerolineae bacterium]
MKSELRAPLWILVFVAALCALNALGLAEAMTALRTYVANNLTMPISPVIMLGMPLIWCTLFGAVCIALALRQVWAFRRVALLITLYGLSRWLISAALSRTEYDQGRLATQFGIALIVSSGAWLYAWRKGWLRAA